MKDIKNLVPFISDQKVKSFWQNQLSMYKEDKVSNISSEVSSNIFKPKRVKFNNLDNTPNKLEKKIIKADKKKSLSCSYTHLPNPNDIKYKNDNINQQRSNTANPSIFTSSYLPPTFPGAQANSFNNYMYTPQLTYYPYCNFYQNRSMFQPGYIMNTSTSTKNNSMKHSLPKHEITKQSLDSSSTLHSEKGNSYSNLAYMGSNKSKSSKSKLLSLINKDFEEETDY